MKFLAMCFILALSLTAEAGRGKNQNKRIEDGITDGSLNEKEATRLENQQDRIKSNRDEYMADGELDSKEKKQLHHQRDRASKNIHKQKHDKQNAE